MDFQPQTDTRPSNNALVPVLDALQSTLSGETLRDVRSTVTGVRSVKQEGDKVTITRDKPQSLPLAAEYLNGNIRMKTLDIADVSFNFDPKAKTASNITGITLNLTVFGSPVSMDVKQMRLEQDATGKKSVHLEVENPIIEPAQRIAGMKPTLSLEIPVTRDGQLETPLLSKFFADAASNTGPSIAGLLTSDFLTETSKIALFVESNERWVNFFIDPAIREIQKALNVEKNNGGTPNVSVPRRLSGPVTNPTSPHNMPGAPNPLTRPTDANQTPATTRPVDQTNQNAAIDQSAKPGKVGDHTISVTIDGAARQYKVHVPPSYNGKTPMPVVLLLHGHAQDGDTIARETKFNEMADKKGFIAVYPDATAWLGNPDWRAWDTGNGLLPPGAKANDVGFLRNIIEQTEKDYAVDSKRIYMAGLSNGGMMCFRAAGELSDKIAAVAVVSGAMSGKEPPLKHPVSLLNIHGTDDVIVPYQGLRNVPSSLSTIGLPTFKPMQYATDYWVEQNRITNPPIELRDRNYSQRRFVNNESGAEVSELTINGDHHVPSDISRVTDAIWNFFESHPKATGTSSGTAQPPAEQPFNITERIKAHARTRGVNGLQLDAGKMLIEIPHLRNGSFSPATQLKAFESKSGIQLSDGVSNFLKSTHTVSKNNSRIGLGLSRPQQFAINEGSGPVMLNSVNFDSPSFDLINQNGLPSLQNIDGVNVNLTALGRDLNVGVKEVTQKVDSAGDPYYRLKAQNPIGSLSRTLLLADSEIPIELQFGENGRSSILNQREIKDSALGVNPVPRGYMDIGVHASNFYNRPGWGTGLNLGKDVGLMGGGTYGGYKLGQLAKFGRGGKIGLAVTVGLVVAPAVIHGIERLTD